MTKHWQERGKIANRARQECGKRGKNAAAWQAYGKRGDKNRGRALYGRGKGAARALRESAPGTRVGYNQGGDLMFVPVPLVANSVWVLC